MSNENNNNHTDDHDQLPTYNLKAVVQETGLKQDTLRAWERRYGLPQPERTSGGHRLYSQRDIETLKWLVARQQEGLSISRAVDLWNRLVSEGEDPLEESRLGLDAPISAPPVATGDTIDKLRKSWIDACMAFDEKKAEQVLAQAAALYSPEVVCFEFLQKALADIGARWLNRQVTVQQEHFASALAIRRLEALITSAPNPTRPGRILVGCPPEELHVFSLLMLTFILRRNGWETIFLGANVPLSDIEDTVDVVEPDLVILAAQQLHTAATLFETAQILQREGVPVAFGGNIFNRIPALQKRLPGYFLGEDLDNIALVVKQVLANTKPIQIASPISPEYQTALSHYRDQQPLIETYVWGAISAEKIPRVVLSYWNVNTARNIIAALTLGDMSYLGNGLEWAKELLVSHNLSKDIFRAYLSAYYDGAAAHLDRKQGQPVLDWLANFAGNPD